MKLTLIGMSGSGKTYWSKRLAERGFRHICCDDLIEEKLAPELARFGYSGIGDVAKWLGEPYEPQFERNQAKYLAFEKEVMQDILRWLENSADNLVIDTTGSVIYTGEEICSALKKYSTAIYIKVPKSIEKKMIEQYFKDPKPVLWGDMFRQISNKSDIKKYYSKLLERRAELYKKYADIVLEKMEFKN